MSDEMWSRKDDRGGGSITVTTVSRRGGMPYGESLDRPKGLYDWDACVQRRLLISVSSASP
jgi:hypothetical protein